MDAIVESGRKEEPVSICIHTYMELSICGTLERSAASMTLPYILMYVCIVIPYISLELGINRYGCQSCS